MPPIGSHNCGMSRHQLSPCPRFPRAAKIWRNYILRQDCTRPIMQNEGDITQGKQFKLASQKVETITSIDYSLVAILSTVLTKRLSPRLSFFHFPLVVDPSADHTFPIPVIQRPVCNIAGLPRTLDADSPGDPHLPHPQTVRGSSLIQPLQPRTYDNPSVPPASGYALSVLAI